MSHGGITEMLNEKEKADILRRNTNMTEYDIKKCLHNGTYFYENNKNGYEEYFDWCIGGLNDEEEIPDMWKSIDVVGDYRVDFIP